MRIGAEIETARRKVGSPKQFTKDSTLSRREGG